LGEVFARDKEHGTRYTSALTSSSPEFAKVLKIIFKVTQQNHLIICDNIDHLLFRQNI